MHSTALALAVLLTLSATPTAVRRNRRAKAEQDRNASAGSVSGYGYVKSLYTWGAASVSDGTFLRNYRRSDGCFPGYRVVNINTQTLPYMADVVEGLARLVGYWHARQPTIKLSERSGLLYPCGDEADAGLTVSTALHASELYKARAGQLPVDAALFTRMCVTSSYETISYAAQIIAPYGWRLVGSATWDAKETHLIQDPSSLDCVLTFQGSAKDRKLDWWDNLRFYGSSFCGLPNEVHGGFKSQLKNVVTSPEYLNYIRTKLPYCASVTAVGHSLGGALAALFSACVNYAPWGNSDYFDLLWSWETPARLSPIA